MVSGVKCFFDIQNYTYQNLSRIQCIINFLTSDIIAWLVEPYTPLFL